MEKLPTLESYFSDKSFAWQILQYEVTIDLSDAADGKQIAKLLQLYMRGVEKMNENMDPRQSYFKNKVTNLMTKQTVVKTLSKTKAMSKKTNYLQAQSKAFIQPKKAVLKQKKQEIQMRMAYDAEQHSNEALKKLLSQQNDKQKKISAKIQNIINSHDQKLMQRIRSRKNKTMTARSISQAYYNMEKDSVKKIEKKYPIFEDFSPDNKKGPYKSFIQTPNISQFSSETIRRSKSLQIPIIESQYYQVISPQKKKRKSTIDLTQFYKQKIE